MFPLTYKIITPCNNINYCGQEMNNRRKILKLHHTSDIQRPHRLRLLRKGK